MEEQQLQWKEWKGPATARAKRMAPEKWEEHKEELCSLYQEITLEALVVIMKEKHDFAPSYVAFVYISTSRWRVC